jgi:hypothetical protein
MSARLSPIACAAVGQPRTFRARRDARRQAGYRRLVITLLGLDVATLAAALRAARRLQQRQGLQSAA